MIRLAFVGALLGLVLAAGSGWAQCTSTADLEAVAATRERVAQQCNCANAVTDGQYKKCALGVANTDVTALLLPRKCRKVVVKCAARSICGRPIGYHPCCRTNRLGKTRCKIVPPGLCKSGPGGSHCFSLTKISCCDACEGPGMCASPSGAFVESAH
jgi:hypothetical protein